MQRQTLRFLAVLMLLLSFSLTWAQAQDDVSQYFEDGGLSKRKNILKTNVAGYALGRVGFNYEHLITQKLGLHAGFKAILPNPPLVIPYDDELEGKGFGVMLGFRHYFLDEWLDSPEGMNWGLAGEFGAIYAPNGQSMQYSNYYFTQGFNWFITDLLMVSYDAGVGPKRMVFDYQSNSNPNWLGSKRAVWSVAILMQLSIGVHF